MNEFEDLQRAVRRYFGDSARLDNIVVPTLGGINRTVVFDVIHNGQSRRLVSRQETYAGEEALFLTSAEQFRVQKILYELGFPVAEPVFEFDPGDGMDPGFISAYVYGETTPKVIFQATTLDAIRSQLATRCGELLAELHAVDIAKFDFLAARQDSIDVIGAFLSRYDFYAQHHPALELGFRWLERNRPSDQTRALVHGDFRCGNLMIAADGIKAVLDWECTHLGSPMEDLGWLCTRSWRFGRPHLPVGGFGERADLYNAYAAVSGRRVDADEIHAWEIFGLVRWSIYNIWQAFGHVTGTRQSVAYAACGRNSSLVEYDLLMTLAGRYH